MAERRGEGGSWREESSGSRLSDLVSPTFGSADIAFEHF